MKKLFLTLALLLVSSLSYASSTSSCFNSDCGLMLHMNGTGSSFSDSSASNHTMTANGDVTQTSTNAKFDKSASFDGTGDYITTTDSSDWDFGTGDFTIESWMRFTSTPGDGFTYTILAQLEDTSNFWRFDFYEASPDYYLTFEVQVASVSEILVYKKITSTVSTSVWNHVAVVRTGNDFKLFWNGVQQGTTVTDSSSSSTLSGTLRVGAYNSNRYMNGLLDEIRIVKGTAIWTSDFTPPSSEYTLCTTRRRIISMVIND